MSHMCFSLLFCCWLAACAVTFTRAPGSGGVRVRRVGQVWTNVSPNTDIGGPSPENPLVPPSLSSSSSSSLLSTDYTVPAASIESLRQRFGERQSLWGDWSCGDTRRFYKQQLPYSLRIDGALGLGLEERALLAAEARHALRMYARERCILPGRILSGLYDGVRHLAIYGSWNAGGLTWEDLERKYTREAIKTLGDDADEELVALFVYSRIVDKACMTNPLFDTLNDISEAEVKGSYSINILYILQDAVSKARERRRRRRHSRSRDVPLTNKPDSVDDDDDAGDNVDAGSVPLTLMSLSAGRLPQVLSGPVMWGHFDDMANLPDKVKGTRMTCVRSSPLYTCTPSRHAPACNLIL